MFPHGMSLSPIKDLCSTVFISDIKLDWLHAILLIMFNGLVLLQIYDTLSPVYNIKCSIFYKFVLSGKLLTSAFSAQMVL
ncbi:uncharacterized protein M6B38_268845 [Iris pallida]|uniref:Uncharacterized protein n=1 Tax=Iris pallida TaxID=29817 RepID=A0AAX6I9K9_IRIPA|nr:uncharacterized protein M6B38_268845 [Iris pallida]